MKVMHSCHDRARYNTRLSNLDDQSITKGNLQEIHCHGKPRVVVYQGSGFRGNTSKGPPHKAACPVGDQDDKTAKGLLLLTPENTVILLCVQLGTEISPKHVTTTKKKRLVR